MTEQFKKKGFTVFKKKASAPASSVSDLLALNMRNASADLQKLLDKYDLELSVTHVIQLRPKRK